MNALVVFIQRLRVEDTVHEAEVLPMATFLRFLRLFAMEN